MRVIPVLDILGGRAVHARAGNRASYAPLSSQLAAGKPGDALAIARAFHDRLGFDELYLADLDAIMGRAPQRALRRAIADALPEVAAWVDAGVASLDRAREVGEDGARRVIIGLESLSPVTDPAAASPAADPATPPPSSPSAPSATNSFASPAAGPGAALARLVEGITPASSAVFSLDLRAGQPNAADPALRALRPLELAQLAADRGVSTIIVLDLARVGTGAGVDLALVREIRRALPEIELVAGGGVRDADDLDRLADAGADAALVGSALHDGSATHGSRWRFWSRGTPLPDVTSPPTDDA